MKSDKKTIAKGVAIGIANSNAIRRLIDKPTP